MIVHVEVRAGAALCVPIKIPKPQDLPQELAEGIDFSKLCLPKAWQHHRNQNFKNTLILTELTHSCLLK